MHKRLVECDRCAKVETLTHDHRWPVLVTQTGTVPETLIPLNVDLCPECYVATLEFLKGGPFVGTKD